MPTPLERLALAVENQQLTESAVTNIRRWLTEPGYAPYAPRIIELIDAGRFAELDTLFWEVIPFGTGGRRGAMSDFGSATMNERTIAESADGLAVYLHSTTGTGGGRAVVAHDTRHRSVEFARLTATTLVARGLQVFLFESHRSTPELSFAVRHLQCDVGVMITASHNPPSDNGFKAYWSNGAQVLPPHDVGIIDCVYRTNEIPTLNFDAAVASGQVQIIGTEVDAAYLAAVTTLSLSSERNLPALFTPLHGVGETSVYRVLQQVGFDGVNIFEPQRSADGSFPNVPNHLPNPELPAVFAPAIAEAQQTGAELILASDPDADRLGAAVRHRNGEFVPLSGNRIAVLLTDYILQKRRAAGTLSPDHYVVETLVTTPLVGILARSHGVRVFDDLLVGFKYIAQVMDREGPEQFVFGAEESLGYLAGSYARDKDAALAALYLCEHAAELRRQGQTLLDRLDELAVEQGYFLESQRSETRKGPKGRQQIDDLMQAFATQPPTELAGVELVRVRDYARHEVRSLPGNTRSGDLPAPEGDMVFFDSKPGDFEVSLAVRPSGTEPKIKFYLFARAVCPDKDQLDEVKTRAEKRLGEFADALLAWVKTVAGDA